jgi:adenosine deaminase
MEVGKVLGLDVPQDLDTFKRDWLLSKPLENLDVALARFVDIQKIWCSEEVIERMTAEACEYAVDQGIRIMEFRYAPDFIAANKPHLTFEKIHAAILRGIEKSQQPNLVVGLIGIIQKTLSLDDAAKTIGFITENAESFVALDFADKDTHPMTAYAAMVDKARKAGLGVTVHAGEDPGPGAAEQVRSAIEILGAERIGHGIHIIDDEKTMQLVRDRDIALEVCPTSNWLTSSVSSIAAHPIRKLLESRVPVTINSDDPALFGIDLCNEYEILHLQHGFTMRQFSYCNEIAAAHSFIPNEIKTGVWPASIGPQ